MTTGFYVQRWNLCIKKAEKLNIKIDIVGDWFALYSTDRKTNLGRMQTVDEVFSYLCGYEAARPKIKNK